jgi:hypothetical protein
MTIGFRKYAVIFFAAIMLLNIPEYSRAAGANDWQGEWGNWSPPEGGKNSYGGSVSIFDCSEKDATCRMRQDAESDKTRCSFGSGKDGAELKITANDSATLQTVDYLKKPQDCRLNMNLVTGAGGKQIKAEVIGANCNYFCTYGASIPVNYSFVSANAFPWLSTRECFYDKRDSRQLWCIDSKIQALDNKLSGLIDQYAGLTHDNEVYTRAKALGESIFSKCQGAANVSDCLTAAFGKSIGEYNGLVETAQKEREKQEALLSAKGDEAAAGKLIGEIDGVYKTRFSNALVSGETFTSEDILEIVPVTADTIYFKTHLEFYNGHECNSDGLARFSKAGVFVFNDPNKETIGNSAKSCRLLLEVNDKDIVIHDPDGTCKSYYCGMRGGFEAAVFPRTAKRKIRYMKILKNSDEYKKSIEVLNNTKQ